MPYKRIQWENDKTPLNADNLNNIEDGIEESLALSTSSKKIADDANTKANNNSIELRDISFTINILHTILKEVNVDTIPLKSSLNKFCYGIIVDRDYLPYETDEVGIPITLLLARFTQHNAVPNVPTLIELYSCSTENNVSVWVKTDLGEKIPLINDGIGTDNNLLVFECMQVDYVYPSLHEDCVHIIPNELTGYLQGIINFLNNKADGKLTKNTGDTEPTLGSNNYVSSGGLYNYMQKNFYSLLSATQIPDNSNLNKYTTIGNYSFLKNKATIYLLNTPTDERFMLKVYYALDDNYPYRLIQELTDTTGAKFIRSTADTGTTWTTWSKFTTDTDLSEFPSLTKSAQIANGSDLNTFITPGMYRFASTGNLPTLINCPASNVFNLEVSHSLRLDSLKAYITQKITDKKGNQYIRTSENSGSTWNEWERLLTTADYINLENRIKALEAK